MEHQPGEADAIRQARAALDAAKIANGSRESDCFQSAEAALKQAEEAVEAVHADIEATKAESIALLAKQQQQAADLVSALEARDAAKKRHAERVIAISSLAPSVL